MFTNSQPLNVGPTLQQSGETVENYVIPAGSMIVPNLQPEAPLIAAILEFDAEIIEPVLKEERDRP